MSGVRGAARFCLSCGAENEAGERHCFQCRRSLAMGRQEEIAGSAFVLNELPVLKDSGRISVILHDRLRAYYLARLASLKGAPAGGVGRRAGVQAGQPGTAGSQASASVEVSVVTTREGPSVDVNGRNWQQTTDKRKAASGNVDHSVRPEPVEGRSAPVSAARSRERPISQFEALGLGWLPEQQANLLLFLGAFLVVAATLIFVGSAQGDISPGFKMALLVVGTSAFLSGGWVCLGNPRVRQAGQVFLALGALMVPLNFVGVYVFFLQERDIDPAGLWFGASLSSALFYFAVSFLNIGRWYPLPAAVALVSALMAAGALLEPPPEAFAWTFVALGLLLTSPATLPMGRASEVLGRPWHGAGHALVYVALGLAALVYVMADGDVAAGGRQVDFGLLWLGLSAAASIFFATAALRQPSAWYRWAVPAFTAVILGSALSTASVPGWPYPVAFALLASGLALGPRCLPSKPREVLSEPFVTAGHLAAIGSGLLALYMTLLEPGWRWFLPATGAALASFYWFEVAFRLRVGSFTHATASAGNAPAIRLVQDVAFLVSGAAAVSLAYALDLDGEWYGLALAAVAVLYVAPLILAGPRWVARGELGSFASLALVSAVAIPFFAEAWPATGAAGLAACLLYLSLARLHQTDATIFPYFSRYGGAAVMVLAAGAALNIAFYALLDMAGLDTASEHDLAWAFFGLACGQAVLALCARRAWPAAAPWLYAVAIATSMFALFTASTLEQNSLVLLTTAAALSLAIAVWERESRGVLIACVYGFAAVLAAQRYFEIDFAVITLVLSGAGFAFYVAHGLLSTRSVRWAAAARLAAFGFAGIAPLVASIELVRLAGAAVPAGVLVETWLYQALVASVLALGLLECVEAARLKSLVGLAAASVLVLLSLLMEIAHFQPENPQAYSAPIGLYFLAVAVLASRYRLLPLRLSFWQERLYALGPTIIMAPSLLRSLDQDAWVYGVILLVESLAFLALAIIERRPWLLAIAVGFVVANGAHNVVFSGQGSLPTWALLALAGVLVMAAGTAILMGRERWPEIQRSLLRWWQRESSFNSGQYVR